MRWGRKPEAEPLEEGWERLQVKFLWKPLTIQGETRWLERAWWWERSQKVAPEHRGFDDPGLWTIQWVPIEWKRRIESIKINTPPCVRPVGRKG